MSGTAALCHKQWVHGADAFKCSSLGAIPLLGVLFSVSVWADAPTPAPSETPRPSATQVDDDTNRTPEPIWRHVELHLEVGDGLRCPDLTQLRTWVNELAGSDFAVEQAPVVLLIRVARAPSDEVRVQVVAREPPSTESSVQTDAQPVVLRTFQRAESCSELLRATALTISLGASSPTVSVDPPVGGDAGPEKSDPESTTTQTPNESTAVLAPPQSAPVVAASHDGSRDAVPRTPPPRTPPPRGDVAHPIPPPSAMRAPRLTIGAAGHGALGMNPGVGVGPSASFGVRLTDFELLLRGGYMASTGRQLPRAAPGTIYGPTAEASLVGCLPVSPLTGPVRVCALGGVLWVFARGKRFDRDGQALRTTLMLGGSADVLWNVGDHLAWGPRLEVLVPLVPVEFEVTGDPADSWTMWPVAPRVGLGIEWR